MKPRTLTNLLLIFILIVLGIATYLFFQPGGLKQSLISTSTPSSTVSQASQPSFIVSTSTISLGTSTSAIQIDAGYPQLSGLADTQVQTAINSSIKNFVTSEVGTFTNGETGSSQQQFIAGPGGSTFSIGFHQVTSSVPGRVASFFLNEEYYSAGAAHPGETAISLNYDLSSGKQLSLGDLFAGKYLDTLSAQSISLLTKQLGSDGDQNSIKTGATPATDNFAVFFPEPDGFHVLFNEYQVASYADGIQEIIIPYSALKSVINPAGPLSSL
jgi:hypothetical protein